MYASEREKSETQGDMASAVGNCRQIGGDSINPVARTPVIILVGSVVSGQADQMHK